MPTRMTWLSAAMRINFLLVLAVAVGWYYGRPVLAVAITLLVLVAFWLYQMRRVQLWLNQPGRPPPEIYGIWGDILSRIYQQQKKGRSARERLQSTVDYLQDSFASMRDGVVIVDDHGVLKWFNQPAQTLLALRPADEGQNLMNLLRAPEFLGYMARGDFREPLQYRTAGEAGTWLRIEITRFGDGDRLLFVRDITASMRMEKVRKDFVANVSHELRTPLTVISGYLDTMLDDTARLEPRYVKALEQMRQQADRMETLLRDLLWLSRLESQQGIDRHGTVDVRALLTELRDELGASHPGRRIELELLCEHKLNGDYRELYSAVSNLVLNAIKYSPQESPIQISWCERDGSWQLRVSDQGIGIDAKHIPRLTERFYRVEDSRASATGGTGLGLAIVKHVAATHGARLQIDSVVGKGSTFSLVFPNQPPVVTRPTAPSARTAAAAQLIQEDQ